MILSKFEGNWLFCSKFIGFGKGSEFLTPGRKQNVSFRNTKRKKKPILKWVRNSFCLVKWDFQELVVQFQKCEIDEEKIFHF